MEEMDTDMETVAQGIDLRERSVTLRNVHLGATGVPGVLVPRPAGEASPQGLGRAMEETEMNVWVITQSQRSVTLGGVLPGAPGVLGKPVTGSVGEASGPGGGDVMERIAMETSLRGNGVTPRDVSNKS